jgi:toxin ParE1/3/4
VRAPTRTVGEYRLSLRTRGDLVDIYVFSHANFGRYKADAYYAGLERTFGLIADFPGIGINSDELVVGYRRFRFQSHYVSLSLRCLAIVTPRSPPASRIPPSFSARTAARSRCRTSA